MIIMNEFKTIISVLFFCINVYWVIRGVLGGFSGPKDFRDGNNSSTNTEPEPNFLSVSLWFTLSEVCRFPVPSISLLMEE